MNPAASSTDRDFRPQILEASRQLCEEQEGRGLTIRCIADRVGISTTVLYRCFDGKPGILGALRDDGLARLHTCLRDGAAHEPTRTVRLVAVCERYLAFAFDHPRLYDLLFEDRCAWVAAPTEEGAPAFVETLAFSLDDRGAPGSASDASPMAAAIQLWAALHGLVGIMRQMQMAPEVRGETVRDYIELLARAFVARDPLARARQPETAQLITAIHHG